MDAVHDEAQAVGLIPGDCLNDKDCAVDCDGSRNLWWAMVNFPRAATFTQLIKLNEVQ